MPKPRYLNLGSGPRGFDDKHWLNVDGYRDTNVHFLLDFSRPLPIPDETFDGVFCEHVIEHFDLEQGQFVLRECARILKPGGCARFISPDATTIMQHYVGNPDALVKHRETDNGCAMDAVNSLRRRRSRSWSRSPTA